MTTAVIGAGLIGGAIARHLVSGGEHVVVAARDEQHAAELAQELGDLASAAPVGDAPFFAAADGDSVYVSSDGGTVTVLDAATGQPSGDPIDAGGSLRGMNDTCVPLLFAILSYWLIGFALACWLGFRTSSRAGRMPSCRSACSSTLCASPAGRAGCRSAATGRPARPSPRSCRRRW